MIACGKRPAELHRELEPERLLALDPIRLPQGREVERAGLGGVGSRGAAAIADVAVEEDQVAAEGANLGEDGRAACVRGAYTRTGRPARAP